LTDVRPDIGAKLAAAGRRLAAGDRAGARALCSEALLAAPETAEAHYLLGEVQLAEGDPAGAVASFDRSIAHKPAFGRAWALKARALEAAGQGEAAVKAAKDAASRAADAYGWDTVGVVFTNAGLHSRAAEMYGRAANSARWTGYWYNYGAALQFLGRLDEARAAYLEALKLDETNTLAWAGLVQITRQTPEKNQVAALMRIASAVKGDRVRLHRIGHALAKAHEDLGDAAGSMAWLATAKEAWRGTYDPAADDARFAAAERSAGIAAAGGLAGEQPIFVVGMPRTGTTLVERILSSHSAVASAGETNHFANAMRDATGLRGSPAIDGPLIDAATAADPTMIGRGYVGAVRATQELQGRFVEKQPFNALMVPHILRALPEARVIMLRRHPADVALSSYRQDFAQTGSLLDYTFSLETTARYVVKFDAMAKVFREKLPADRYMEIAYEDVVADLGGQVRRLLDFCGLPFEEACLNFHDNTSPVATASAAQVRQPLYSSSVGRWRKYRPAIDPALNVLVEGGVMRTDELA
jgi:tetratricopeptide (TPR) repeat protein